MKGACIILYDKDKANILRVDIEKEMRKSFLEYSMSVIVSRALPDVRDGLKPVHRRILYTLHENGLTPEKPYRKCADTVGAVLGRYHPHGDSSVYDALVRLAQGFSLRYPLVDGHGNFGSVDGDPPAAYRYTEAKMSKIAVEMLTDINKDTVDYQSNYDDRLKEPVVLPSRFPNLLVNGAVGIAVGMATNIPPHNLGEVIDGINMLIENPDCDYNDLMEVIQGPDFPTGGIIMGRAGIRSAYATGKGKIILRAKTHFEEIKGRNCIIVTEIPYMVNKAKLVEHISDLVKDKKIDGIHYVRDESDRNGMRIVVELKKDAIPNIVLNRLFSYTQLQDTVGVIMLALVDNQPKILNLKDMLVNYLNFQKEVIKNHIPLSLTLSWNEDLTGFVNVEYYLDDELINFRHKVIGKFEKAKNKPITKEKIEKQLSKTGGTPFYIDEIKFHNMPDSLFIPISELNQIRREVLSQAQDLLLNHYTPTKKSVKATRKKLNKFYEDYESFNNLSKKKNPKISLFIDNLNQLKSISGFDLKRIYFDGNCLYNNPEDYYENIPKLLEEASLMTPDAELVWVLSSFINEKEASKCNEIVKELESKGIIISVMGDFPGMGEIFDCPVYGNHNLNVWNSFTVKNLKEAGFNGLILSSELSGNEIKHLISKNNTKDIDLELIVNGNLEVIVSKDDFSNLNDGKDFIIHNNADYAILEDKKRKKFKYKVLFDYNKQSHIINKDCLCLIEEMNEIKHLGLDSIILDCRYSNEKYTTNILSIYNDSLKDRDDEELSKYKYQIMDFSQSYINKGNYIEGRLHEDKHENS